MMTPEQTREQIVTSSRAQAAAITDAAIELGKHGLHVFPTVYKHKIPRIKNWNKVASSDEESIRELFGQFNDKSNISILTGPASGVWVLDIDDPSKVATLLALTGIDQLPYTTTIKTRRGFHYWFKWVEGVTSGVVIPGIDVKGARSQTVAPPSVHPNGHVYEWVVGPEHVAEAPEKLVQFVLEGRRSAIWNVRATECENPLEVLLDELDAGREITAIGAPEKYIAGALKRGCENLAKCTVNRNNFLNRVAFEIAPFVARGFLDEEVATSRLGDAASTAGLNAEEIQKTIQSALDSGGSALVDARIALGEAQSSGEFDGRELKQVHRFTQEESEALVASDTVPRTWVRILHIINFKEGAEAVQAARRCMTFSGKGKPRENDVNAEIFATALFKDRIGYDIRRQEIVWRNDRSVLTEQELTSLYHQIPAESGVAWNRKPAEIAVLVTAQQTEFDPVAEYLEALEWDGTLRIDGLLHQYFGADDNAYTRAVGRYFLIQAVARALKPGCQADCVLVLYGAQGIGKSTGLRALAGEEWFTDHLPDLSDKDAKMALHGPWIIEMAELAALQGKKRETVKAFITSTFDKFRPPYGRRIESFPRRMVFAGTTNSSTWMRDPTGERRFWPVEVKNVKVATLDEDRDQLWAEAVAAFKAGERYWFESQDAAVSAWKEVIESQTIDTGWEDHLEAYLNAEHLENSLDKVLVDNGQVNIDRLFEFTRPMATVRPADRHEIKDVLERLGYRRTKIRLPDFWQMRVWTRES